MTDKAHAEFERLIGDLADARDEDDQGRIRKAIWDRFGTTGAAFVSDMANFSSTSRSLGITHFLKLIHRKRRIVAPLIKQNNGVLIKFDAENCYAYFSDAENAVQASFDISSELFRINQHQDLDEQIFLSVGIDFGDILLIGDSDFFGDPVNTSSKLGEDLATKGETLITERALHRTTISINENIERMTARISEIEINYVRIPMTEAIKGKLS